MKLNKLAAALFGSCVLTGSIAYAVTPGAALPGAKPGECYAQVVTPAQYRTESSTIVVKEASERVRIIPAKFGWEEQRVMVSESGSQLRVIPAKYRTERSTIEVAPARTEWVYGSRSSNQTANPEMLRMANAGGANLDNATPGQCFHEHYQPARYESVKEQVLVSEASYEIELQDAEYEWVEQRIQVSPESSKLVEIPATYKTVQEKVLVESAKTIWKKGRGSVERIDEASGEVMCLVEIPAVYKSLTKKIVNTPASSRVQTLPAKYETVRVRKLVSDAREVRKEIPARYKEVSKQRKVSDAKFIWHLVQTKGTFGDKTGNVLCKKAVPAQTASVSRRVLSTPARTERVEIPAKYETKKVRVLASDAREERTAVPAETRTIESRIKVADARLEWSPVLCEINATTSTISQVQRALKSKGYNPGRADGVFGRNTMTAVDRFQRANNLATGGLTFDTLRELGVNH